MWFLRLEILNFVSEKKKCKKKKKPVYVTPSQYSVFVLKIPPHCLTGIHDFSETFYYNTLISRGHWIWL